ncbi:MAG: EboA domain-containing protein [Zavarzinella sp.]
MWHDTCKNQRGRTLNGAALILKWLNGRLNVTGLSWLQTSHDAIAAGDKTALFRAFSLAPRKVGKADLNLSADSLADAQQVRPGWDPSRWSIDQATRAFFVSIWPASSSEDYVAVLDQLYATSGVEELVALYQALPILPFPPAHRLRAAEGVRTNMKPVFAAIATHNPYPAEQLEEMAWNQMVLKCLFVDVSIIDVQGIWERSNPHLAQMLFQYAKERWAAKRVVNPLLWYAIGPHADGKILESYQKLLRATTTWDRQAAVLALQATPTEEARRIEQENADLIAQIRQTSFTWPTIAAEFRS